MSRTEEFQDPAGALPKKETIGWQVSETYAIAKDLKRRWLSEPVEDYVRRRSEEDWAALVGKLEAVVKERDQLEAERDQYRDERDQYRDEWRKATQTLPIQNEPYLGLATTEQMLRELIVRFKHDGYTHPGAFERAIALAEMLGSLSAPEKEYRTVDHD